MARGRPKSDEPTWVLAVRVPMALREQLDRYLDALETRVGLKAAMRSSAMPCASSSRPSSTRGSRGHPRASRPPETVGPRAGSTLRGQKVTSRDASCGAPRPGRSRTGGEPVGACTVVSACARPIAARGSASPTTARAARLAPHGVCPLCTNPQS